MLDSYRSAIFLTRLNNELDLQCVIYYSGLVPDIVNDDNLTECQCASGVIDSDS